MKDIIISGGFNIRAIDLEKMLLEHPDITAVAVIGAPSAQRGEIPVAFVEVWGPISFNVEAAKNWVNTRLDKQEQIYEMHVMEHMPRSPMGEVLKRELRDKLSESAL